MKDMIALAVEAAEAGLNVKIEAGGVVTILSDKEAAAIIAQGDE